MPDPAGSTPASADPAHSPTPRPAGVQSELGVVRLLTAVSGGVSALVVLSAFTVVVQPNALPLPGWYRILLLAVFVFPVVVAILCPGCGLRALRRLSLAAVLAQLGALAVLLLLVVVPPGLGGIAVPPVAQLPWMLTTSGVVVVAAVVAWGARGGWIVLGVIGVSVQLLRILVHDDLPNAIVNDVQTMVAAMVACLLSTALVAAGAELDRAVAAAGAAASTLAAERARREARVKTEALVHDEILATLLFASHDDDALRGAVAVQAAGARQEIHDLAGTAERNGGAAALAPHPNGVAARPGSPAAADGVMPRAVAVNRAAGERIPVDAYLHQLRQIVAETDAGARLVIASRPARGAGRVSWPPAGIDVEAGHALAGAVRQALVNARRHAGPEALRSVTVTGADGALRIEVRDTGRGFDPVAVAPDRMGVATSILARVNGVPGGSAGVRSAPGRGTVVTLEWAEQPSGNPFEAPRPPHTELALGPVLENTPDGQAGRPLLLAMRWAVLAFLVAQAVMAFTAFERSSGSWTSLVALLGLAAATALVGWRDLRRPSRWRTAVVVALVVATPATIFLPSSRSSLDYWDAWYLYGCAFVLAALVLRGRRTAAIVGFVLMSAVTLAAVRVFGYGATEVAAAIVRPAVIMGVGLAADAALTRLRRRTRAQRSAELAARHDEAYQAASRAELTERARHLEGIVGPMLDRLASGEPLTPTEARECAVLEGLLRDHYRGGRLAREPLTRAVMAARRRGVDVMLLDDGPALDEPELAAVVEWMRGELEQAASGRFTGRILPEGRETRASVVLGDTSRSFATPLPR
ncbi:ATP-binding protein [Herbiconiux sp. 11R-BC]|uniref:sensor histidine kinase n=1 Tax=Herbiconiux sp. 11R-BC TaxID=3111637 RepID=UPI003C0BFAF3